MTIEQLINEYEEKAQRIREEMPEHERWGSGKPYRNRLDMIEEFLRKLREVGGHE